MDKILSDFEGEAYAFPMGKNFELHFPIQPRKKQRALLWRKKTPPYSLRLQINVSIIDRLCGDLSNFIIKSKSQIIRFNERGIEFSPAFAHPVRSEKEFELKWRIGMGITGKIVYHASKFPATIQIVYKNHTANAKDAIEVLALNDDAYSDPSNPPKELGLKAGSRIKLVIQGPDADAVMGELTELFTCDDP